LACVTSFLILAKHFAPVKQALAGGSSMDCINQIKEKLKKYPDLRWELDGSTISVSPENGFTVWLVESEQGCTVGYNGWHEEFSDKNEALNCFAFGLSEQCRLKVFIKGKTEYKWVLEALEDGIWVVIALRAYSFIHTGVKRRLVTYKIM